MARPSRPSVKFTALELPTIAGTTINKPDASRVIATGYL